MTLHKGHRGGNTEEVKAVFQTIKVLSLPALRIHATERRSRDLRMELPAIAPPYTLPKMRKNNHTCSITYSPYSILLELAVMSNFHKKIKTVKGRT